MDIINKTRRPVSVPLPGGKRLFLGPGHTGQIRPDAAEHPPLKALIDAGDLEIGAGGPGPSSRSKKGKGPSGRSGFTPDGGIRHSGDR